MLSIRELAKTYAGPRQRTVLTGIDLELVPGDYVAVMGESGIGKSTLLNLIAGLDRPDAGSIALDGVELAALDDDALTAVRRVKMGFVFQAFHVLPYLTVAQNVALPLSLVGVARAKADAAVAVMLAAVGLAQRSGAGRASFPAANCSGSRSPARWSTGRDSCWPTSPPAISTPRARHRCCACCAIR